MCSGGQVEAADQVAAGLGALAATDVLSLDDRSLRGQLLDLITVANQVHAELARRVDVFDRRGLAEPDGFRTTKTWLQAFGRLSGHAASRLVTAARLLRRLPKLAAVAQTGEVSAELVARGVRFPTPPVEMHFGWWSLFEDNDGHPVRAEPVPPGLTASRRRPRVTGHTWPGRVEIPSPATTSPVTGNRSADVRST